MAITLAEAEAKLAAAMDAYDKALNATSYNVSGGGISKSVSRASLTELQASITFWENKVARLTRGGMRVRGITPATD